MRPGQRRNGLLNGHEERLDRSPADVIVAAPTRQFSDSMTEFAS